MINEIGPSISGAHVVRVHCTASKYDAQCENNEGCLMWVRDRALNHVSLLTSIQLSRLKDIVCMPELSFFGISG